MPREIITIPVGQCGNQIAWRFWDLALREHAMHSPPGVYDEGMSTFFANVREDGTGHGVEERDDDVGKSRRRIRGGGPTAVYGAHSALRRLKARAVLVDMEEGVVSQVLRSPVGDLFDRNQLITDVSGAGNNWAHGYCMYGPQYRDDIMEQVRKALEAAESPQSFFMMHSMGGGTGSGVGTYILSQLADAYPELYRFTCAVFPSADDDVVTSPYNFTLAFQQLQEHADCILPLENQALLDVVAAIERGSARKIAGANLRTSASPVILSSTLSYVPPAPILASRLMFARHDTADDERTSKPSSSAARRPAHAASDSKLDPRGDRATSPLRTAAVEAVSPTTMAAVVHRVEATERRPSNAFSEEQLMQSLQRAESALERALKIAETQPSTASPRKSLPAAPAHSTSLRAGGVSATRAGVARGAAQAAKAGTTVRDSRTRVDAARPGAATNSAGVPRAEASSSGVRSRSAAAGARTASKMPAVGIIPGLVDPRDRRIAASRATRATGTVASKIPASTGPPSATAAPTTSRIVSAAPAAHLPHIAALTSSTSSNESRALGAGVVTDGKEDLEDTKFPDSESHRETTETRVDDEEADTASSEPPAAPKPQRRAGTAFDAMNNVAAHLLTHMTASMRFEGALNVDLNEITTTLVPFPGLKLLQSSISPLYALSDVATSTASRRIDSIFSDAFVKGHQLFRGDPRTSVHLACGLLLRGDVVLSDARRNVDRLKSELRMARWNPDGFKLGICNARPIHQPYSLLALSNNTSVVPTLQAAHDRFMQLYRVRAHMHHYTEFMDFENIRVAGHALTDVISSYNEIDADFDLP